jgi:hypothetical protein
MFDKTDKKYLYWIIESYLSDKITGESFCNAFYESYDLEINLCCLSEAEQRIFDELNAVVGRYSHFKEDIHLHPGVYFNDEQLRTAVQKAKDKLPFEFGLEKYAIRFLCSFFKLYSAFLYKVEIGADGINGIIHYEYDDQIQEFSWIYPMDKRIKSAIEFLDFINEYHLNQGEIITKNKDEIKQLLLNQGWSENKIMEAFDYVLNLNIQMIDEGYVTNYFIIRF